tara:strand:+ start:1951 stop:3195 length:1245 start_codon:yes stop_codon:yes gene_type:complete
MNILEKYASNCGVKIRDPFVSTSYFPLPEQDYIIIDDRNKYESNIYNLFEDVMTYIEPVLDKHNIIIYNFAKDAQSVIEGAEPFLNLFKKQESYLIKHSKLIVGCDNMSNYFASALNVPSIGLYSPYPSQCTSPLWSSSHLGLESHRDGNLPAYGVGESPKTINFIEPEKIANEIFKKLGLEDRVEHETFHIGDLYPTRVVEVIPDFVPQKGFMEGRALNLRMDYEFNEQMAIHWLQNRKINILTDKPINLNLLKYFKKSIAQLTININEHFTEDYLRQAKATGNNVQIFCEDLDKINDYRFKFFDFEVNKSIFKSKEDLKKDTDNRIFPDRPLILDSNNTMFLSGKILLSQGKKYSCREAQKAKKELTGAPEFIYDTDDFWKELDHYRLINGSARQKIEWHNTNETNLGSSKG